MVALRNLFKVKAFRNRRLGRVRRELKSARNSYDVTHMPLYRNSVHKKFIFNLFLENYLIILKSSLI